MGKRSAKATTALFAGLAVVAFLCAPNIWALPVPPVIRPSPSGEVVQVRMHEFRQKVHRDLPPTTLWGYNGMWPGPTFEVRRGQALSVNWTNQLPTKHFLPIAATLHGCGKATDIPTRGLPLTGRPAR